MDFLDAVFGCSKEIEIDRLVGCTTCEGSGNKPGTTPVTCPQCGGSGQLVQAVRTPLGAFQQVRDGTEREEAACLLANSWFIAAEAS